MVQRTVAEARSWLILSNLQHQERKLAHQRKLLQQ